MCPQKHLLHPQAQLAAGLASLEQMTLWLCAPQTPGKHTSCFSPCLKCAFFLWMIFFCYTIIIAGILPESTTIAGVFLARISAEDSFWCPSPLLSRKCLCLHFLQLFLSWLPAWLNSWWISPTAARCLRGANHPNALRASMLFSK